ncbi:MAG: ferredoxin oxidoreductase, partial [Deltaproteobacteria bacterium]
MDRIKKVNDFVVRFANGSISGSASVNTLFTASVFSLGVYVSPKKIFLPGRDGVATWHEVRISDRGYLGRRGGYDFMVANTPETMVQDYLHLAAGGYFLYDSEQQLPAQCKREDITLLGIPLSTLATDNFTGTDLRQSISEILSLGAAASFLDIDLQVLLDSINTIFAEKPEESRQYIAAVKLGYNHVSTNFPARTCLLSIEKSRAIRDSIITDGNSATALGALHGGATAASWYPITPATPVMEAFARYCKKRGNDKHNTFAVIEAEDEPAAMSMVLGACWNGARAFTATSGPGLSVMSEFLGLAYFAEIPLVLIDVQRTGSYTGMPTRNQQSDILAAAYASHGDCCHILLFPCNPTECFTMTAHAFELAERLQTPVLVMSDLDLGINTHVCDPLPQENSPQHQQRVTAAQLKERQKRWSRYLDENGDGICSRILPGSHPLLGSYFTRDKSQDKDANYSEKSEIYEDDIQRLQHKWERAGNLTPEPHSAFRDPENQLGVLFFGTSTHASYEAVGRFATKGIKMNTMRLRGFPFRQEIHDFIKDHRRIFLI